VGDDGDGGDNGAVVVGAVVVVAVRGGEGVAR
jgi:hypothetical protein